MRNGLNSIEQKNMYNVFVVVIFLPLCSHTVATSNLNEPINLFGRKTLLLCKIYTVDELRDAIDRDSKVKKLERNKQKQKKKHIKFYWNEKITFRKCNLITNSLNSHLMVKIQNYFRKRFLQKLQNHFQQIEHLIEIIYEICTLIQIRIKTRKTMTITKDSKFIYLHIRT